VSLDSVRHPHTIAEQMLRCSALRQAPFAGCHGYQRRPTPLQRYPHRCIRARACGGATHRRPCRDGEALPAESWNAVDQLALPGLDTARIGSVVSAHPYRAGRRSGRLYSTPVDIIELDDQRWLVAGYEPTNWVRNPKSTLAVNAMRSRRRQERMIATAMTDSMLTVITRA
jgi:hypothetical protein